MHKILIVLSLVFAIALCAGTVFAGAQEIVKIASDINVSKDMTVDDCIAIGGNITVYGKVTNNVVAVGGSVDLKQGSSVGGEVVIIGGALMKADTATIGGKTTEVYMPNFIPSFPAMLKGTWLALWAAISILVLLGFLGLAVLLVALIPEHIASVVHAMEHSFVSMFLWGILGMILIVPIAVLLAISLIGIVLIPLEILLVVLALIIGYITSAIFIGKNVLLTLKKEPAPPFVDAIVGILILFLIGFIPLVGPVVKALFLVTGFGAVVITRFGTLKHI